MNRKFTELLFALGMLFVSCTPAPNLPQPFLTTMLALTETATSNATPTVIHPMPSARPLPSLTATPGISVFDTLIRRFVQEADKRRAERRKSDADYAKRIDKELNEGRVNFLFFGYGETYEPPSTERLIIGSYSIVSYNTHTKTADIISLTHDVRAPEIERQVREDERPSWLKHNFAIKIDQAYRAGGFELMRQVVENATGLSVDFQIVFKDALIIDLVDNLFGAIDLEVTGDFDAAPYYLDGVLQQATHFAKGTQKLNGTRTIQFMKALVADEYNKSLERNVRKVMVFRAMMESVRKTCNDRQFWLKVSSFAISGLTSERIAIDFDLLSLVVSNIGAIISGADSFVTDTGACGVSASNIGKTIYVVDPAVGDGGVQWIATSALTNPVTQQDMTSGRYPYDGFEVPFNADPYGDLVTGYWLSVRSLVKKSMMGTLLP